MSTASTAAPAALTFDSDRYSQVELFIERTSRSRAAITVRGAHEELEATMNEENYRQHFTLPLEEPGTYHISARNCTIALAYLSGHPELLQEGVRYLVPTASQLEDRVSAHFEPVAHWMNDPNGLCRFQGLYHLFYQFNPYGWNWDNMHWGHAVSEDLVAWRHLPVVLFPQPELERDRSLTGGAFSGSAVPVDAQGVPCRNGDKASAIRLYLTRHMAVKNDDMSTREVQATMICEDGITFGREHVVLSRPNESVGIDFRDPKVDTTIEGEGGKPWMVLATNLPVEKVPAQQPYDVQGWFTHDPLLSRDLATASQKPDMKRVPSIIAFRAENASLDEDRWNYLGPVLQDYEHRAASTFECPDMFELDGTLCAAAALMHYCDAQGRFQPVRWYIGDMPDREHPRMTVSSTGQCDFGSCYYAAQSFLDHTGRRIAFGWLSDWYGVRTERSFAVNGAMSLPRELHVRDGKLYSRPVREVYDLLVAPPKHTKHMDGQESCSFAMPVPSYYADIALQDDSDFDMLIAQSQDGDVQVRLQRRSGTTRLLTHGMPTDHVDFVSQAGHVRRAEVFYDGDIVEVFLNNGEHAGTLLVDDRALACDTVVSITGRHLDIVISPLRADPAKK